MKRELIRLPWNASKFIRMGSREQETFNSPARPPHISGQQTINNLAWAAEWVLQHIAKSNLMSVVDLGDRLDHLMVLWLRWETKFGNVALLPKKRHSSDILIEQCPSRFCLSSPIQRASTPLVSMGYLWTWPRACKAVQIEIRIVGAVELCLCWHWSTARSRPWAMPSRTHGF